MNCVTELTSNLVQVSLGNSWDLHNMKKYRLAQQVRSVVSARSIMAYTLVSVRYVAMEMSFCERGI